MAGENRLLPQRALLPPLLHADAGGAARARTQPAAGEARPVRRGAGAGVAAQEPEGDDGAVPVRAGRRARPHAPDRPRRARLRPLHLTAAERGAREQGTGVRASAARGDREESLARTRGRGPGLRGRGDRQSGARPHVRRPGAVDPARRGDPQLHPRAPAGRRPVHLPDQLRRASDRGDQSGQEPPPADRAGRLQLGQPLEQGARSRAPGSTLRLERAPGGRGRAPARHRSPAGGRHRSRSLRPGLRQRAVGRPGRAAGRARARLRAARHCSGSARRPSSARASRTSSPSGSPPCARAATSESETPT